MLIAIAIFGGLIALNNNRDNDNTRATPLEFAIDDKDMNAAIEKAKETSSYFIDALNENNPAYNQFTVKLPFSDDYGAEHLWISDVTKDNDKYFGIVSNRPLNIRCVEYGQRVEIDMNQISDWVYFVGPERVGGFTIAVMESALDNPEP